MPRRSAKETAKRDMQRLRNRYGKATVDYHSPAERARLRKKLGSGAAYRAEMERRRKRAAADRASRS